MKVLALFSSLLLATARRVTVLEDTAVQVAAELTTDAGVTVITSNNASVTGPYEIHSGDLPTPQDFIRQSNPMLFPMVKAKEGSALILNVREKSRHSRVNDYKWEVQGTGEPIRLGRLSTPKGVRSANLMFKVKKGKPALLKLKQYKRFTNRPIFHITSPGDSKKVYYSIVKRYGGFMGKKQRLYVYLGRCTKIKDCKKRQPVYQATGKKSNNWTFHRLGDLDAETGKQKQILAGSMKRTAKKLTKQGYDETFQVKIVDPKTDVGLVMAAVTLADVHQNVYEKGQWGIAGAAAGTAIIGAGVGGGIGGLLASMGIFGR